MVVIRLFTIVPARVFTMVPSRTIVRPVTVIGVSFIIYIVMLPLNVLVCFLAFQTLEVPNNRYTLDMLIHAIISARSLP